MQGAKAPITIDIELDYSTVTMNAGDGTSRA
jgi:hypothetical protein